MDCLEGKTILETKMIFKRNFYQHGRIEKGFIRQILPPRHRVVFGIIATLGWEACQLEVGVAYIEADVDEIYIELPEARRKSKDQVGLLKRAYMASSTKAFSGRRRSGRSSR